MCAYHQQVVDLGLSDGGGDYRAVWGVWSPQADGGYGSPHTTVSSAKRLRNVTRIFYYKHPLKILVKKYTTYFYKNGKFLRA